ncbi:MAG: DUF4824 family protein [bacterium]|nr:DUF4824 family protein [bacterium]
MKHLVSPVSVVAACGLIVVTNLAILSAAGWNRRGEPQAELSLTERELAMPTARQDEGTGLELSLVMTHEPPGVLRRTARWKRHELPPVNYGWLNRAKLLDLGFRVDLEPTHLDAAEHYSHAIARRTYVVVEYDGEAWNRWIGDREEQLRKLRREVEEGAAQPSALADAEAVLAVDRTMRSRLFPVDAGVDADALQRRYGNRRRHAVVAGLLRPKIVQPENGAPTLSGEVLALVVSRVHVSRRFRQHFESFLPEETWEEVESRERREAESGWPSPTPPRYQATLAVGRRHEPWLVEEVAK